MSQNKFVVEHLLDVMRLESHDAKEAASFKEHEPKVPVRVLHHVFVVAI